jgi:hypothetical protein
MDLVANVARAPHALLKRGRFSGLPLSDDWCHHLLDRGLHSPATYLRPPHQHCGAKRRILASPGNWRRGFHCLWDAVHARDAEELVHTRAEGARVAHCRLEFDRGLFPRPFERDQLTDTGNWFHALRGSRICQWQQRSFVRGEPWYVN